MSKNDSLAQRLVAWQLQHGRHDLPWQNTHDAYRIWLSEIMLQQTQVVTVIDYYARFLDKFPTVQDLARASQDEVLALWAGLGYYSRARNLHACAQRVVDEFGGEFPRTPEQLQTLPGIGVSTAAAIAVFAYAYPAPILDGNVKRILSRVYGIRAAPSAATDKILWANAHETLFTPQDAQRLKIPFERGIRAYTQGVMDLGATLCTRTLPNCQACPWSTQCVALAENATEQIPAPKVATAVKELHFDWYIYRCGQGVWLEQQPERGIWAKLWTFPTQARLEHAAAQKLTPLKHRLTHRQLHIQPYLIELNDTQAQHISNTASGRWLDLNEPKFSLALPKPAEQLLRRLSERDLLENG